MAEQYARALTSLSYAAHREELGLGPDDLVIGSRRGLDDDSEPEAQSFEPMLLPDALAELTRREGEAEVLPRLVILDQLVRLARSPGRRQLTDDADEVTQRLQLLLRSLAPKEGVTEDQAAAVALDALHTLAREEGMVDDPWGFFVDAVGSSFALTAVEVNKPRCNDSRPGGDAGPTEVTVEFWTDREVSSLAHYANPLNWPACSVYFAGMVPQGPSVPVVSPTGTNYCGWEATLVERLALFPPYNFVTPLRFTSYWAPGWSYLRTAYRLEQPTADIIEDAGFIEVAKDPYANDPSRATRVTATKVIEFARPDINRWPSLACDTFWIEMAIQMAHDCACAGEGLPASPF